jgi:hypothetical protein
MSIFFQSRSLADITQPEREAAQLQANIDQAAKVRSRTKEQLDPLISDPSWYSGALLSGFARISSGAAYKLGFDIFDNDATYNVPLNFEPKKMSDPTQFGYNGPLGPAFDSDPEFGRNNLEGLLEMTNDIPDEDRRFILNAPNWGELQDRLSMYRMKDPSVMEEMAANYGGSLPIWADVGTDAAALVATGMITEPLAWLGTASRLSKAGTAAAEAAVAGTAGAGRVAAAASMAQNLAKTAPVISLAERAGRYAALGVIDQTILTMARYGTDDFNDQTAQELAIEYAGALALGGAVGGALSKRMANDLMRGYAESSFSTLPIAPITAQSISTPQAGVAISGILSAAIPAGPTRILGSQAGALANYLRQVGITPKQFLADLKAEGILDAGLKNFADIPTEPEVLKEINKRLSRANFDGKVPDLPVFQLASETLGKSGTDSVVNRINDVVAKTVTETAEEGDEFVSGLDRARMNAASSVADRLIADMNAAGYTKVKDIPDIPNDPDTLAKLDAWFDDIEDGRNSPFGFRRIQQDPTQPTELNNVKFSKPAVAAPTPSPAVTPAVTAADETPLNSIENPVQTGTITPQGVSSVSLGKASPLPGTVPAGATGLDALEAAVPVNNIRIPWLRRFLNQAALLLEPQNNPHARHFAYRAFFARRVLIDPVTGAPVPQPRTVSEEFKNILDTVLARQIRSHQAHFQRFALGMTTADNLTITRASVSRAFGRGSRAARQEFDNRVWTVMSTGTPDASDVVNSFAAEMRTMMTETAEYARQAGVPGFEMHRMLQNYFPRLYNFDSIQRVTATAQGRAALTKLLAAALEFNPGTRQLRLWDPHTGSYQVLDLPDIDLASRAFSNRLMELAVGGEGAPLLELDRLIIDSIEQMQGPLRDRAGSPSPRGRPRIVLNENVEIDAGVDLFGTGTTMLRFGDIVNRDLVNVSKKYTTSVLGATAERQLLNILEEDLWQMGFRESEVGGMKNGRLRFKDTDEWVAFANREGQVRANGRPLEATESNAVERIRASLKFEPRVDTRSFVRRFAGDTAENLVNAGVSVGKAYTFLLYAGLFGAAALSETGRLMGTYGPIKVLRELPIAVSMMREWNDLSIQQKGFTALLDQFGIATDRLRRTIYSTPEAEIQFSKRGKARRALGDISNIYSDVTLLAPITSFTQFLTGITTLQHLLEMSRGQVKQLDESTILSLGLTKTEYEAAGRFLDANAVTVNRRGVERIVDLNNTNHPDFDVVRRIMDRMVKTRIQDVATIADTSAYADSAVGSLLTQFRNYNIKALDNLLLQNYSRFYNTRNARAQAAAGAKVASEIAGAFLMAGLVKQAITIINAQNAKDSGNLEEYYKIREGIGLKGFLKQGLMGPGELWLPSMATEAGWSFISDEPLLSQYRYSSSDMLDFPVLETAKRAQSVVRDVAGEAMYQLDPSNPNTRFITRKTTNNASKLVPLQNYPPIARYLGQLEEYINDEYDLPYEQPRR